MHVCYYMFDNLECTSQSLQGEALHMHKCNMLQELQQVGYAYTAYGYG